MPQTTETTTTTTGRGKLEFTLVLIMLGVLTVLVAFILFSKNPGVTITPTGANLPDYLREKEATLNYRKDLLAIIIAAFGAWVGAGAAYFFGRENLRESANSLLQLHRQATGVQKLGAIKVRDIPPKPLNANYDEALTLKEVMAKLIANTAMWFVSIKIDDKWYVVNNEAFFIYVKAKLDAISKDPANQQKTYADLNDMVLNTTLKEAIPELEKLEESKNFVNKYLLVTLNDNAAEVNKEMDERGLFLGVIKNEVGDYVQYFTTSDIRKALLNL